MAIATADSKDARMVRVRYTTSFPHWPLARQTPGGAGRWGDYQFLFDQTNPDQNYDFWVVFDRFGSTQRGFCAKENILFLTAEPPSLAKYPNRFLSQFGIVVTCHPHIRHPHVIFSQQAVPWHVGIRGYHGQKHAEGGLVPYVLDYDKLKAASFRKTKLISVIASAQRQTRGHYRRFRFVQYLRERLGDRIDVFGHGVRDIADKWDGIADYKYHVAVENFSVKHYWTEKLGDSFLGGAFPLYYGCPNIEEYFPKESMQRIDISNPARAVDIIESTIASGAYEKHIEQVDQARNLVLDKYNFFPTVAGILAGLDAGARKSDILLEPLQQYESFARKMARRIKANLPRSTWRHIK
jgi:hypothetical protein